jgi:hypothetical protein
MPVVSPGNMVNSHVAMPPYAPGHPSDIETSKDWAYFHQRNVNPLTHWAHQTPVMAPAPPPLLLSTPTPQPQKLAASTMLSQSIPGKHLSAQSAEARANIFTATDLLQLACVCVDNNVFVAPYGEVTKT